MLTIHGTAEVRAASLLFQRAPAETRKALQAQTKAWAPTLVAAAKRRARGQVQNRIAASGKTTITGKGLVATFGSSGRVRNAALREIAKQYEFGTSRQNVKSEYLSRQRVSKKAMRVKRRTKRQLPSRQPTGHFVYPAVADTTPELVSRYVRAIAQAVTP